jgi:hypothetical protein
MLSIIKTKLMNLIILGNSSSTILLKFLSLGSKTIVLEIL